MAIFDTSIIIDYLRGKKEAKEVVEKFGDAVGIGMSTISCYEIMIGTKSYDELEIGSFFQRINAYPLDMKSVVEAAIFYRELRKRGKQLSIADTLILGTAKANDEQFITMDKDFEGTYDKLVVLKQK